jgi:hypothetical protein
LINTGAIMKRYTYTMVGNAAMTITVTDTCKANAIAHIKRLLNLSYNDRLVCLGINL